LAEEEEEEEERSAKITAATSNRSNGNASQRSQFSPSIQQDVVVVTVLLLLLCVHCKFPVDLLPVSHGCLFFDGLERRTGRPSERATDDHSGRVTWSCERRQEKPGGGPQSVSWMSVTEGKAHGKF